MSRRPTLLLLLTASLAGCADTMQRIGSNGLTPNQQTDVALFELVVRYVRDSLGGPLSIDGRLTNQARWPTVGLEPDGSRADADRATAARREVLRQFGIPEAVNVMGSGCGTPYALRMAPEHRFTCPPTRELRVLIGPFYSSIDHPDSVVPHPDRLHANVVETWIGPDGFTIRSMDYEVSRSGTRWRITNRTQRDSLGLCDHAKVRPFDDCR